MADVTGPISTLPGAAHVVPAGQTCDTHSDRPATRRVQGETDSMGCEMHDMCDECHERYKQEMAATAAERATGRCDWCGKHATDLRPRRDWEEGSCGRLYDVCGACVKAEHERLAAERDEFDDEYNDFADWDWE